MTNEKSTTPLPTDAQVEVIDKIEKYLALKHDYHAFHKGELTDLRDLIESLADAVRYWRSYAKDLERGYTYAQQQNTPTTLR